MKVRKLLDTCVAFPKSIKIMAYINKLERFETIWSGGHSYDVPISLLEGSLTTQLDSRLAVRKDDGSIEVVLPDDVLRIVSARLSSWSYSPPVSDEHSEVAAMQMYPCSKGTYDSPACVLYSEDGEQILRMYSAWGKDDKVYVSVIRKPTTIAVGTGTTAGGVVGVVGVAGLAAGVVGLAVGLAGLAVGVAGLRAGVVGLAVGVVGLSVGVAGLVAGVAGLGCGFSKPTWG